MSPFPLQSKMSENASSSGTGIARSAGINGTDVGSLDTSVEWPPQHRVKHCVFEHVGPRSAGNQPGWRGPRAVRLASRSSRATRRRAWTPQEEARSSISSSSRRSCTPLSELLRLTKDPQSYALTGRLCERWEAGPKATLAYQAPEGCTSGPVRRPPSHDEELDTLSECRRRGARNAGRGCPAVVMETGVLGHRVTAPTTRQQQLLVRRSLGITAQTYARTNGSLTVTVSGPFCRRCPDFVSGSTSSTVPYRCGKVMCEAWM